MSRFREVSVFDTFICDLCREKQTESGARTIIESVQRAVPEPPWGWGRLLVRGQNEPAERESLLCPACVEASLVKRDRAGAAP